MRDYDGCFDALSSRCAQLRDEIIRASNTIVRLETSIRHLKTYGLMDDKTVGDGRSDAKEVRDVVANKIVACVYKDGTYMLSKRINAWEYESDPSYLVTISREDLTEERYLKSRERNNSLK